MQNKVNLPAHGLVLDACDACQTTQESSKIHFSWLRLEFKKIKNTCGKAHKKKVAKDIWSNEGRDEYKESRCKSIMKQKL